MDLESCLTIAMVRTAMPADKRIFIPVMTTNEASVFSKQHLRQHMRAVLRAMSEAEMSAASGQLMEHLKQDDRWLPKGAAVALFGGIAGEPELLPLIPWLAGRGCTVVYFGMVDGQLVARKVRSSADLERGVFGVWVPRDDLPVVDPAALEVILTPGLAFDHAGRRLGRGRGFFDQLFARSDVKARRIGLCWDCQMVAEVPVEPHDARMHAVITETGAKMEI